MMKFGIYGALTTVACVLATTTIATADHSVPTHFKFTGLKIDGNKCNRSAFSESFWTKGIRGEKMTVNFITRVCGSTRGKWEGLTVNINWVDDQGRVFTDCERFENAPHQCWITLPEH